MTVRQTKARDLPRRLVLRCTECTNEILIPFTTDEAWIQRYLWLNGEWLLSVTRDAVEGEVAYIELAPICATCQPEHMDPELLATARATFRKRHEN